MARHSCPDAHHRAVTGKPHYVCVDGSLSFLCYRMFNRWGQIFPTSGHRTSVKMQRKVSYPRSLSLTTYVIPERRLVPAIRACEQVFAAVTILVSLIGGDGLICLTIFDTKHYTSLHHVLLVLFWERVSARSSVGEACPLAELRSALT